MIENTPVAIRYGISIIFRGSSTYHKSHWGKSNKWTQGPQGDIEVLQRVWGEELSREEGAQSDEGTEETFSAEEGDVIYMWCSQVHPEIAPHAILGGSTWSHEGGLW
jgi:hypothetical protein